LGTTPILHEGGNPSRPLQEAVFHGDSSIMFQQQQRHSYDDEEEEEEERNKRSRDYCFMEIQDYKPPCSSFLVESVDILSSRFSQLGHEDSMMGLGDDNESDSETTTTNTTPRKRICRGLIRTKRSAKLCLLVGSSSSEESESSDCLPSRRLLLGLCFGS